MHFGENQLSPRSIGISPLPTAHPSRLQPTLVRASTGSYTRFPLAMGRSRGFGSTVDNVETGQASSDRAVRTRFRSGSPAERVNPLPTVTRRFILQKARHHQAYNPALTVCRRSGFRFYFTPLPGFFSPFPHGTGALSVAKRI